MCNHEWRERRQRNSDSQALHANRTCITLHTLLVHVVRSITRAIKAVVNDAPRLRMCTCVYCDDCVGQSQNQRIQKLQQARPTLRCSSHFRSFPRRSCPSILSGPKLHQYICAALAGVHSLHYYVGLRTEHTPWGPCEISRLVLLHAHANQLIWSGHVVCTCVPSAKATGLSSAYAVLAPISSVAHCNVRVLDTMQGAGAAASCTSFLSPALFCLAAA